MGSLLCAQGLLCRRKVYPCFTCRRLGIACRLGECGLCCQEDVAVPALGDVPACHVPHQERVMAGVAADREPTYYLDGDTEVEFKESELEAVAAGPVEVVSNAPASND